MTDDIKALLAEVGSYEWAHRPLFRKIADALASQAEEITRLRADKEPFTAPWDGSIYYGLNPKAHAILSRQKELAEARAEAAEAECQGLRERLRERSTTP